MIQITPHMRILLAVEPADFTLPAHQGKHTKPYKKIRTLWAMEQQPMVTKKAGEFDLVLTVVDKKSSAL